jgi:putative ABC transport system substrate-binding protein
LLGGAAAAWPLAARAQQPDRVRRVGVLMGISDDPEGQARISLWPRAFTEPTQAITKSQRHSARADLVVRVRLAQPVSPPLRVTMAAADVSALAVKREA